MSVASVSAPAGSGAATGVETVGADGSCGACESDGADGGGAPPDCGREPLGAVGSLPVTSWVAFGTAEATWSEAEGVVAVGAGDVVVPPGADAVVPAPWALRLGVAAEVGEVTATAVAAPPAPLRAARSSWTFERESLTGVTDVPSPLGADSLAAMPAPTPATATVAAVAIALVHPLAPESTIGPRFADHCASVPP